MDAHYITMIRRDLTLVYICNSTSITPSLELGVYYLYTYNINVTVKSMCTYAYKILYLHGYVHIVCSVVNPNCVLLYVGFNNAQSPVLQCAVLHLCHAHLQYTTITAVVEEGG